MASVTSTFYEDFSSKSGELYAKYIRSHVYSSNRNADNVIRQAKLSFLKEILTLFNDKNLTDEVQITGDKFLLENFDMVVGLYMKSLLKTHLVPRLNKVDLLWAKALKNAQSRRKRISLKNMTIKHLYSDWKKTRTVANAATRNMPCNRDPSLVARDKRMFQQLSQVVKNRTTMRDTSTVAPRSPIRFAGQDMRDNAARNRTMRDASAVARDNAARNRTMRDNSTVAKDNAATRNMPCNRDPSLVARDKRMFQQLSQVVKNRTTMRDTSTVAPRSPIRFAGQDMRDNAARNRTMRDASAVARDNSAMRMDLTDITSTALTLFRINNDGMNPTCRNYLTRGGYSKYVQKKNQVIGFTATEYTIKKKNEIKEYLGDAESASLVELYFKECGSLEDVEQYDSLYVFEHFNDFGLPSIDISKRYLYSNEVIKRFTNKVLVPCPLCFTIGVEEACLGTELGHSLKQSKAAILYGFSYALECGRSRLLGEGARTNKLEVKDGTYYWEKEKDTTKLCSNRHWFCCKECKARRNTKRKTKKRKREPHEAFTRFEHLSMNYGLSIRVANVLKTLFDCSSPNYTIGEVVTKVYLNDEDATLKVSLEEINKINNIQVENFVISSSSSSARII